MDSKLSDERNDSFSEVIDDKNESTTTTTTPLNTAIDVTKCLTTKQLLRNAMQNLPKLNVEKRSDQHMIVLGSNSSQTSLIDKLNKCSANSLNTSADAKDGHHMHKWTQLKNSMTQQIETQSEQKWKQRQIIEKIENEELDDLEDEEIDEDIDEEMDEEIDEEVDEKVEEMDEKIEEMDEKVDEEIVEKNDEEVDEKVEENDGGVDEKVDEEIVEENDEEVVHFSQMRRKMTMKLLTINNKSMTSKRNEIN